MDAVPGTQALHNPMLSEATQPAPMLGFAHKRVTEKQANQTAQDFEAMFITQMMQPMFNSVEIDETFGGGSAEETFRGMMVNEYGSMIAKNGGFGLASAVKAELLRNQEAA